jgi:hypothetical protein
MTQIVSRNFPRLSSRPPFDDWTILDRHEQRIDSFRGSGYCVGLVCAQMLQLVRNWAPSSKSSSTYDPSGLLTMVSIDSTSRLYFHIFEMLPSLVSGNVKENDSSKWFSRRRVIFISHSLFENITCMRVIFNYSNISIFNFWRYKMSRNLWLRWDDVN